MGHSRSCDGCFRYAAAGRGARSPFDGEADVRTAASRAREPTRTATKATARTEVDMTPDRAVGGHRPHKNLGPGGGAPGRGWGRGGPPAPKRGPAGGPVGPPPPVGARGATAGPPRRQSQYVTVTGPRPPWAVTVSVCVAASHFQLC